MHSVASRILSCAAVIIASALAAACTTQPTVAEAPVAAAPTEPVDERILGSSEAPVMIIEFTDLQCPYCARFALTTWPELKRQYVDTGKVRFATRDLPLPFHAFALPAAVAARCAGRQGRFWEYREVLFRNQSQLPADPHAGLAQSLGLDVAKFADCRSDPALARMVQADAALAAASNINSTPTFVIGRVVDGNFDGEMLSGAQPFEVFQARIDSLLQQAGQ